jgi:hypothetical protein
VLVSGELATSGDGDTGLELVVAGGRTRHLAPLGEGVDQVAAVSPDGRWIAVRHTPKIASAGEPPRSFALDVVTEGRVDLPLPKSAEVEPIGFLAGEGR